MRLILHGGDADEHQYEVSHPPAEFRVLLPSGQHAAYELAGVQDGAAHYTYIGRVDP